jgi:CheY-like chemotaxis protein
MDHDPLPNALYGRRILVVDDVPDNHVLIATYLARTGAVVEKAINGADAVDMVDSGRFDIVLMDIHMPVMDGFSAAKAIRKTPFGGVIVAVTATDSSGIDEIKKEKVFNLVLRKPISRDVLLSHLSSLLTTKTVI